MNYLIVKAGSVSQLELMVNDLVREGWRPMGGMVFVPGAYAGNLHLRGISVYQTLFREPANED
jgi:hypothetical protein